MGAWTYFSNCLVEKRKMRESLNNYDRAHFFRFLRLLAMKGSTTKLVLIAFAIMGLSVLALVTFEPAAVKVASPHHGYISIEPASFLKSLFGTTSKITCRTASLSSDIAVWQDITSRPLLIEALPATNAFMCLYLWDGDLRLLRINPNKRYDKSAAKENDTSLKVIVSSPWEIQDATVAEWTQLLNYLVESNTGERPPQFVHLLPTRFARKEQLNWIIQGVQMREGLMKKYGAHKWPMVVTLRYPTGPDGQTVSPTLKPGLDREVQPKQEPP